MNLTNEYHYEWTGCVSSRSFVVYKLRILMSIVKTEANVPSFHAVRR
jgi:hypothetical protein